MKKSNKTPEVENVLRIFESFLQEDE